MSCLLQAQAQSVPLLLVALHTPETCTHSSACGTPHTKGLYSTTCCSQSNARFAVSIDPQNPTLAARKQEIDQLRSQKLPTVPSNLGQEKAANPFLRCVGSCV